jgi:succinate dehydrogenase hydrophobic anchor subunit
MSLTDRRTVYGKAGTPTPLWMWVFQRLSGLLLGPLIVVHILVPRAPFIIWISALLLALIVGHAFIGLFRLAAMRQLSLNSARLGLAAAALVVIVIAVFGIVLLYSIS